MLSVGGLSLMLAFLQIPALGDLLEWGNEPLALVALAGVVAIAGIGVVWRSRHRIDAEIKPKPPEDINDIYRQYGTSETRRKRVHIAAPASEGRIGDTLTLKPGGKPGSGDDDPNALGWLHFLDASAARVPISARHLRIGRHSDNDIVVDNKTVHRHHAIMELNDANHFEVRDLGGMNGLFVNGERCTQHELKNGDLIELGEVRARFFDSEAAMA